MAVHAQQPNVTSSEQALRLPEGALVANIGGLNMKVSFSSEVVLQAAQKLIDENDAKGLKTQAEVIARAGKHGWGEGDVYLALGEGQIASADRVWPRNRPQWF
jgi:hypothetical protein